MELPDEAKDRPKRVIPVQIDGTRDTIIVSFCHPEGAGEERPCNPKRDRSARRAACTPELNPEGPGRGERARPDAERALLERPSPAPERLAGEEGNALGPPPQDSEEDEAEALAERAERAGEGDRPLPRFPPERDLSLPVDRPWHLSGREDP